MKTKERHSAMSGDLEDLKKQVEAAQKERGISQDKSQKPKTPMGKMLNAGVELVAGVLVGVAVGLLIDWYFGTSPFGLITLFILGSAAGMLNVYRTLTPKKENKETEIKDG